MAVYINVTRGHVLNVFKNRPKLVISSIINRIQARHGFLITPTQLIILIIHFGHGRAEDRNRVITTYKWLANTPPRVTSF
jgi:hypothetical protein